MYVKAASVLEFSRKLVCFSHLKLEGSDSRRVLLLILLYAASLPYLISPPLLLCLRLRLALETTLL